MIILQKEREESLREMHSGHTVHTLAESVPFGTWCSPSLNFSEASWKRFFSSSVAEDHIFPIAIMMTFCWLHFFDPGPCMINKIWILVNRKSQITQKKWGWNSVDCGCASRVEPVTTAMSTAGNIFACANHQVHHIHRGDTAKFHPTLESSPTSA